MQKLYTNCLETANIEKVIRAVYSHEGAKTAGVDGISKTSNITKERIIKEVKLRLRRYKPVRSRIVQIPKGNGEFRSLTIINLFDRIAQQAVYQIISPILEEQMSKHSYGFRKGIGAKTPVSRLATTLNRNKDIYTVELDLKKCFDNIPLDKAIERLKEMEIKNFQLLRTIKHLMWTSKEYLGVGLSQGTVIGPLLANCYLTKLDRFMEETFTLNTVDKHYLRNYKNHEENWIQCNMERGKYIDNELDIEINEAKSHYRHNEIHFLGFKIVKSEQAVWVLVDNYKEYAARLKQFKFNTYAQCQEFMKWFCGVLNYFDIVNDMGDFSGYYNAHSLHEYIIRSELECTIEKVGEMVADAAKPDFPKFVYVESFTKSYHSKKIRYYDNLATFYTEQDNLLQKVPSEFQDIYETLLVMESFRAEYGDQIL